MLARFAFECCGAVDAEALVGASLDLDRCDGEAWRALLESLTQQLEDREKPRVYPLVDASRRMVGAGFADRFDRVWGKLVERCRIGAAYDVEALGAAVQCLSQLSSHSVVHCRHTGSAGAMELAHALVEGTASLEVQREACARQLKALEDDAGPQKPKKGSKREAVATSVAELEASIEATDALTEAVFEDVFCKRYRDTAPAVRAAVVSRLGKWIAARPGKFLETRYLKYLAWVLDFPSGAERAVAATALASACVRRRRFARPRGEATRPEK